MDRAFLSENARRGNKREWESSRVLVENYGRPCYPIKLWYTIMDDPRQYGNMRTLSSFGRKKSMTTGGTRSVPSSAAGGNFESISGKLAVNGYHETGFLEYTPHLIERRQRHGLDGDVQLLENVNKQNALHD